MLGVALTLPEPVHPLADVQRYQRTRRRARIVVVVEDEEDLRASLRRFLELAAPEFEVLEAANADEALSILSFARVDTVVSDLRMPGATGLELLAEVARRSPNTHRILITAFPASPEFAKIVNRGEVDGLLVKPFEPDVLLRLLRRVSHGNDTHPYGRVPPMP